MRRALFLVLSIVAAFAQIGLTACGDAGGGSGGTGATGGTGPGPQCGVGLECGPNMRCEDGECVPAGGCPSACETGFHCSNRDCLPDYTLTFIDPPAKSSTKVRLVLEVRPAPGVEPVQASLIELATQFNGIDQPSPTLQPVEGQDNRWVMFYDVSTIKTNISDGVPLFVRATLKNIDSTTVKAERTVNVDNKPPDLSLDATGPEVRRDKPISLRANVADSNAQGTRVFAYLTGTGQEAPSPAPLGWTEGTPKENNRGIWDFTLDQRTPLTNLEGQDGTLDVHLWASDLYGNATTFVKKGAIKVTRKGWDGDLGNLKPSAPAVMLDGRVAVLSLKSLPTGKDMSVFDESGTKAAISVNNLSAAYSLSIGDDGAFYISTTQAIVHASLTGSVLQDIYRCQTPSNLASKVSLAQVDGEELAVVTTAASSLLAVRPNCTVLATETITGASGANAVIGLSAAGTPVVYVGGQTPQPTAPKHTMNVFELSTAALTRLAGILPAQYDAIKDADLALDGLTVLLSPRYKALAASLDFSAGFDQNPVERVLALPGVSTDPLRPTPSPIVTSSLVVFPTSKGLMALPRTGPWSKPVIYEPGKDFQSTPVAGEGDAIYAIDNGGLVHAVTYTEVNGPELKVLWTTQLGDIGETYRAPLTLTCGGMLVAASEQGKVHTVVTDSRGLDETAPWPKYQHDLRNTGDANTSTACE